jgi:hypothetical protein
MRHIILLVTLCCSLGLRAEEPTPPPSMTGQRWIDAYDRMRDQGYSRDMSRHRSGNASCGPYCLTSTNVFTKTLQTTGTASSEATAPVGSLANRCRSPGADAAGNCTCSGVANLTHKVSTTVTLQESHADQVSSSVQQSVSKELGSKIGSEIEAGVPGFGSAKISGEISASMGQSSSWGQTRTQVRQRVVGYTTQQGFDASCPVTQCYERSIATGLKVDVTVPVTIRVTVALDMESHGGGCSAGGTMGWVITDQRVSVSSSVGQPTVQSYPHWECGPERRRCGCGRHKEDVPAGTTTPRETSGLFGQTGGEYCSFGGESPVTVAVRGNGTTHSASAWFENPTDRDRIVRIPSGVPLVPGSEGTQTLVTGVNPDVEVPAGESGWVVVEAYCNDRTLAPPASTESLRVTTSPDVVASQEKVWHVLLSAGAMLEDRSEDPERPAAGPYERSHPEHPRQPVVTVQPGSPDQPPEAPRPSFGETCTLQAIWAVTNNEGKPDREHLVETARTQFEESGVPPEKAEQAATQVADEVIPVAEEIIEQTETNEAEEIDWEELDLTLKGL